jgi:anti-anti-sigma factor
MPVTLEQSEKSCAICLEGAVDIGVAAELKELLAQALGSGSEVRVSLEQVSDLDVTAVQLLWAAARAAKESGVVLGLQGEVSAAVAEVLKAGGFEGFPRVADAA